VRRRNQNQSQRVSPSPNPSQRAGRDLKTNRGRGLGRGRGHANDVHGVEDALGGAIQEDGHAAALVPVAQNPAVRVVNAREVHDRDRDRTSLPLRSSLQR